ncbi:MAG: hypothetical protein KatS3mg102_1668 [Planctomycetota bacterium]|nr:MAG: hypothetical protein KatS3mg102_1668 [Planctomycetota bacterium]
MEPAGGEPRRALRIEVDYDPRLHFALQQNDVPLVRLVRLRNEGERDLAELCVCISIPGGFARPWEHRLVELRAGTQWNLEDIDLQLDGEALQRQTERMRTELRVEVRAAGGGLLGERCLPLEVLAANEWAGLASLPELLAAFVTPNLPAVSELLSEAAERLRASSGDPSLCGYQRGAARARAIVQAIYEVCCARDIRYASPPASFERHGQKVRFAEQVLASRLGTCLDLVLLLASCLEQAGLHPLLVLLQGHALVGCWLDEQSFAAPAQYEPTALTKRIDLEQMLALEASALAAAPPLGFARAVAEGSGRLREPEAWLCAIDVRAARRAGIRPLPLRAEPADVAPPRPAPVAGAGRAAAPAPPLTQQAVPASSGHAGGARPAGGWSPRGALPAAAGATAAPAAPAPAPPGPADRLERWQRKLLDLSLRNRLLDLRDSRQVVPLAEVDLAALEDALAQGKAFELLAQPELFGPADPRSAGLYRERTGEQPGRRFVQEELAAGRLHAALDGEQLERRLLEIYRARRLGLQESGANLLFLVLGLLRWYETPERTQPRRAPLLLLPLELERQNARAGFRIRLADDEALFNLTLREKLAVDFGIDTRAWSELPEDAAGLDVPAVLERVRRGVLELEGWDVLEQAALALLSFPKLVMWLDLQRRAERLRQSPLVRHLVERPGQPFAPGASFPDPERLDEQRRIADTLCPLDADASQLAAVFAAADGWSFVLQGPPGTGKSQTIANLIAHALAHGKRVLFVAEKMAALEVVYRRLEQVGLGPFCLQLHSHRANKREVLQQLGRALEMHAARQPEDWQRQATELERLRADLNAYVQALHRPQPESGQSVRALLARLCALREVPRLPLSSARSGCHTRADLERLGELLARLVVAAEQVWPPGQHPLRELRVVREEGFAALAERLRAGAEALRQASRELAAALAGLVRELGEPLGAAPSRLQLQRLAEAVGLLRSLPPLPVAPLLRAPDFALLQPRAAALIARGQSCQARAAELGRRWHDGLFALDLQRLHHRLGGALRSPAVVRCWHRWRARRQLRAVARGGRLPRGAGRLLRDVLVARRLQQLQQQLCGPGSVLARLFGPGWELAQGAGAAGAGAVAGVGSTDWEALAQTLRWAQRFWDWRLRCEQAGPQDEGVRLARAMLDLLAERRAQLRAGAPLRQQLEAFAERYQAWACACQALEEAFAIEPGAALGEPAAPGYLERLEQAAQRWAAAAGELDRWAWWQARCAEAIRAGLEPIVRELLAAPSVIRPERLRALLERAVYEDWLQAALQREPVLQRFFGPEHERLRERFCRLDEAWLVLAAQLVQARLQARLPARSPAGGSAIAGSELGVLRRELEKKRRHLPLRRLFAGIPALLSRLAPCMLMSPLSVAQYLDPEVFPPFDLVVFDEASQIPVWDALGALGRAQAAVVVGDTKQLPPTRFFERLEGEEAEAEADDDLPEELESLLQECVAAGLPELQLRWHYRSRHESLIAFSNHHYYDNRLLTFPAAVAEPGALGVSLRYLADGVYDRGGSRTNRREAEELVAEVVRRLLQQGQRHSLGIVTFSRPQQVLVEDLLDAARREHPELEPFFDAAQCPEPVFVKNLENVQGDERDVVLFSIGYGPDAHGRVSMHFGPLHAEGGERRLNVAITRARCQLIVFSSILADHIDLARTRALGVRHLKTFLDYAARGPAAMAEATALDPAAEHESPLEREVAQALRSRGYLVDAQVGCSGYRIDLAIRDPERPGRYVLGIECDGASYHSGRTARERDRLRAAVLRGLGWELERVWSSEWWRAPERELARLQARIEQLLARARAAAAALPHAATNAPSGAPAAPPAGEHALFRPQIEASGPPAVRFASPVAAASSAAGPEPPRALGATPTGAEVGPPPAAEARQELPPGAALYRQAELPVSAGGAERFYQPRTTPQLLRLLAELLECEAPLAFEVAARRLARCFGIERLGKRVRQRVRGLLGALPPASRPVVRGGFLWRADQQPDRYPTYRLPAPGAPAPRTLGEIPPEELANAALAVLRQHIALPADALARELARLFGGQRLGRRVRAACEQALEVLRARGLVVREDGQVRLAG